MELAISPEMKAAASVFGLDHAMRLRVVPMEIGTDSFRVGMSERNENVETTIKTLVRRRNVIVEPMSADEVFAYLRALYPHDETAFGDGARAEEDTDALSLLHQGLDKAIQMHVSDAHYMWTGSGGVLGWRIDREMDDHLEYDAETFRRIVRVGLRQAEMSDGDVFGLGHFTFVSQAGRKIDCRVQVLPEKRGPELVLRLTGSALRLFELHQLGMPEGTLEDYEDALLDPHGLHLVVGPMGCGKSTTSNAIIQWVRARRRRKARIVTIEDPIEVPIADVTQIEVDEGKGVTFAGAVRAFVRVDPDLMVVGETRDRETASACAQAAMYGRQVVTTLHAFDSIAAIERLALEGVDRSTLEHVLRSVLAQRLIPKLCKCKVVDKLVPREMREEFKKYFPDDPAPESLYRASDKGCRECNGRGTNGVVPIFELLVVTRKLARAILNGASYDELRDLALKEKRGYLPMMFLALDHLRQGDISYDHAREAVFLRG